MADFLVSYINGEGTQTIEANSFLSKEGFINFYNSNSVIVATINAHYVLSVQKVTASG